MKENAQQTNSTFKWNETRKIYVHTTGIIFPENTCHKFAFSLCVLISKTGRRPCNVINNLICRFSNEYWFANISCNKKERNYNTCEITGTDTETSLT